MLEIGSLVDGKYKILNKVGQGGMSVVYLAMNERANKQWAVKEVRKDGVLDFESVKQGLVAETDILKKLSHPHLPSIIDVIDTEDSFIIIMDYVQGNSLDKALKEFGAQSQEDVIEWAKQLCDVLGYLHTREPSVIYRDMKPANVMLKPDGSISLIDFGTAREHKYAKVEDTTCLGTRGYAAPEQYGGMGQTDARTDIYCLGATIYHLVTGMNPSEPPYEIRPIREIDPSLSGGLEKIILKCTQNNPNDRYQSCAELMYALEHYNEIDDAYRKQQKNKLSLFISTAAATLVFAMVSIWGFFSAEAAKAANYDQLLANANTEKKYFETIVTDPTRTEAYLGDDDYAGLVDFLIDDDGKLSRDDKNSLDQLRNGYESTGSNGFTKTIVAMNELQEASQEDYAEVCYKIGESLMFYYDVDVPADKYNAAAVWLKEAVELHPVAGVYCDMAECLTNIKKYSVSDETAKLSSEYETLWGKMIMLSNQVKEAEDDLKIKVWTESVTMIRDFCAEFCQVTSPTQLNSLLNDISQQASQVSNTFLEEKLASLQEDIDETLSKIKTVQDAK